MLSLNERPLGDFRRVRDTHAPRRNDRPIRTFTTEKTSRGPVLDAPPSLTTGGASQFSVPVADLYGSGGDVSARRPRGESRHLPPSPPRKRKEHWSKSMEPRMTFGEAIEALKAGKRVARSGWNGREMWLTLIKAGNAMHLGLDMQDCIGIRTAQRVMQPGWLASQADMLSDDWHVVES